ncbi:MAG: hypothetical protein U5L96_12885 [Owenweeksia sp.]|nr:hypothetical protein [Owenweeksia sp.]
MKSIITAFIVAGIFVSCNSPEQPVNNAENTSETAPADTLVEVKYAEIDSDEALIATALMAAPEESRVGCKVIGYNMKGEFVTLKEGDNEFICLADNPGKEGFSAACYHKDLEPFMARGRELRAEGKNHGEIFEIREEEVKSGKLKMGGAGTTLHVYFAPAALYDPETSEVAGASYRYVVYMPWATAQSTGLPETPLAQNHPWIMNPGTHRARIMITPKG